MKFPYLRSLGKADDWYRVGPLAEKNLDQAINLLDEFLNDLG